MSRKERIKTYLTGVLIGVALLVVWQTLKGRSTPPATPSNGVPSAPASNDASDQSESASDATAPDGPEVPRSTP